MPEDETQKTEETQDTAPTAEDLEAIKAQLEEEKEARASAQASLAEKDNRIAELESQLSEVQQSAESLRAEGVAISAELASVKEARERAVAKYLNMARALNPSIPEGIIAGETIEEIDQSIEKGQAMVEAVKKAMEAEASRARVPAGAPTRGAISLEGLTPREKIAYGIQQGSQR
jgi:septal ring factor EnvC (AmiA/AmiB activator)